MAWVLAVILALGVGLPIAAWRLSRRAESRRRPGGLWPLADQVDTWLFDRHHLSALDRKQVRDAVM